MVEGQVAQVLDVAEGVTEVAMRLVMLPPGVRTHPAVTWHLLSHLPSAESVRVLRPEATTCHRRWAMWPRPRGAYRVSGQGLWPSGTHALSGAGQPVAAAGEVLPFAGQPSPVRTIGGVGNTRCDVASGATTYQPGTRAMAHLACRMTDTRGLSRAQRSGAMGSVHMRTGARRGGVRPSGGGVWGRPSGTS